MLQKLHVDPSKARGWALDMALQDDYMEAVYAFERVVHEHWRTQGRQRRFKPRAKDICVPHLLPLLDIDMLQDVQDFELEYDNLWPKCLENYTDSVLTTLFNSPVMEQTWYWPHHFKAKTIQRCWRRCIACPDYVLCRRRLMRECTPAYPTCHKKCNKTYHSR